MNKRYNIFQRILSSVLAIVLVVGLAPMISTTASGAESDPRIFGDKKADPSTMDWKEFFGPDKLTTEFAGMVWSDKSVYAAESSELPGIKLTDEDNFLVSMSAIASNLSITGHTTAPTDTMLVLDLSGSMISTYEVGTIRQQGYGNNYNYTRVNGQDVSLVEAMVDATNAAIDTLMEQNPNNRVGVVLFSGNTDTDYDATTASATVVLPLGRYEGVAVTEGTETTNEYLSLNVSNYVEDAVLYEWVRNNQGGNWGGPGGGGNNGSWQPTGETKDYIPTNSAVSVSVKSGLTAEGGGTVTAASKSVGGGTYTQNGLYQALAEFNKITDTRVPDGKVQSGADRVPAIVLMTDGAPTIATSDYNEVGTSNTGNGGSENSMITFLTQLTAAYVRGAVSAKYTEEGSSAQKVLFLTLGLGTENSTDATNTLYPAGTTGNVASAWSTYLDLSSGDTYEFDLGGYERTVSRDSLVSAMNYVDKYYYADDAASLTESFEQVISEIELKAETYATLVENVGANFSGYVTFEDELGELMEVIHMKGILLGDTLFTGEELAHGMTTGNLGTPGASNEKGDELIATVKERIPGTDTTAAQQLVNSAYLDQQLYWESESSWSNYIGWYADENGNYVGFWDKDAGYENAPTDAVYANKSYGYLGENKSSDMMHVVVMVRTNLKTLHQTVFFKIPAALLPTVTYNVTLDEANPDQVKEFTQESADPIQVVFEVGLRSDINSFNLDQRIKEHTDNGGHIHRNADGSVTLYTNAWGSDNDADKDGNVDYNEALTAKVALAHFHPALDNGCYYYTEDTLVLDASGNPVTTADRPTGTGYHHDHYIYSAQGRQTIDMAISAATLEKAQQNTAGQWFIPAGTIYQELSRFRNEKDSNETETLDYSDYPAIFGVGENQDVYNFLGNNGSITIAPATGISLTKTVDGTIADADTFTFQVELSDTTVTPVLTDANGNAFTDTDGDGATDVSMTDDGNGKYTVTMPAGITAYITGIPGGTTVTVTEVINGDYRISEARVGGVAQTVVSNSVSAAVPVYDEDDSASLVVPVSFTNTPNGYGDLVISKDVTHNLAADPEALAGIEFTFQVKLTGDKIVSGTSTFATSKGKDVIVGSDGYLSYTDGTDIILHNEESITVYDIPEGTAYTVTESDIPGFVLDSINGETATQTSGTIVKDTDQTESFVNRYPDSFTPVSVPLEVNVSKYLEAKSAYTGNEEFVFVLEKLTFDGQGNPVYPPLTDNSGEQYIKIQGVAGSTVSKTAAFTQVFEDPGTYYYRIVELKPSELDGTDTPGMDYSTMRALFEITVTDNDMDGLLEIAVKEEAHVSASAAYTNSSTEAITGIEVSATFTNTYEMGSTSTTLNVHKVLNNATGVEKSTTDFQFTLTPVDANGNALEGAQVQTVTTSALGDATFNIFLDTQGTFYYKVREVIPAGAQLDTASGKYVLNGMYYDPAEYLFTVVAEPSGDNLVVTSRTLTELSTSSNVDAAQDGSLTASFVNDYILAESEPVSIPVSKELTGRDPEEGETFSFSLVQTNDSFTQALPGVTIDPITIGVGDGKFVLRFDKAGSYHYKLTEIVPTDATPTVSGFAPGNPVYTLNGITYDNAEYHITVTVTDKGNGTLTASWVMHKVGETDPVTTAAFTNVYSVTGTDTVTISGVKTLEGTRDLVTGEFSFGLYDESGKLVETVSNMADGSFSFSSLEFTVDHLGTNNADTVYTYTVREILPVVGENSVTFKDGVTYTTNSYEIKITVSHKDGILTASASPDPSKANFTNEYHAADATVLIHGSKTLVGDWSAVANSNKGFTFQLYKADASFQITDPVPETVTVSAQELASGKAAFTFTKTYTEEQHGFHYYILREDTSANAGGVGYDAGIYRVTVSVSDAGVGQMVGLVSMYRPGVGDIANDADLKAPVAAFSNSYSVESTEITLEGTKTLSGRDMDAGEFKFQVLEDGRVVAEGTNAAAEDGKPAAITFDAITYTEPGKHTYSVVEVKDTTTGGVKYHETPITVVVDVVDNGDGTMTASVAAAESETVAFVNTYSAGAAELELGGTKILTGRDMEAGEFTFRILDENDQKVADGTNAAANDGETGAITFEKMTFTEAKVYNYTIVELKDTTTGGVKYSEKTYALVITVTDNGEGQLSASYTVDGAANGTIAFENTYTAASTSVVLNATKKYDKPLAGNDFTFTLKGSIGTQNVSQEKKNDAKGQIAFDKLTFTQAGTYTFQVSEVVGILGFIRYDKTLYEVVVTVTDDGKGQLSASYTVNTVKNGNIVFTNSYILDGKGTLVLEGTKELTGRDMADGEFSFGLYDESGKLVAEAPNAGGKFTLKLEGLNKDHIGKKLTYTVKEILPVDSTGKALTVYNGVTYDQTAYKVEVTVTDNGTGGVNVAHKLVDAGSISFKNAYAPALSVSKTQTVGSGAAATAQTEVKAGDTVTYTITVKNTGAGTLLDVTASDKIPAGLVLKAGTISNGGTENGGVITWKLDSLAAGETVSLTFQVVVPRVSEKTVWKNIAAVSHSIPVEDPDAPGTWSSNEVELVEYVTESPQTGDSSHIVLIVAAMLLSGGAMTALIIAGKKKKAE